MSEDKVVGASSSRIKKMEQDAPATLRTQQDGMASTWQYFHPNKEIDIRNSGNLPHWEQGSVWYFVTFRLADALPKLVVEKLKQQREHWKTTHDIQNLSPSERIEYHQLFTQRYEDLLNAGSGSCVLRDEEHANIVRGALQFFEGKRYELDEYVIMPNHVHVLVRPLSNNELVKIVHSWKSFTANQINQRLGTHGQLWQHESFDHMVRNPKAMDAIRSYIRENPIVARASSSQNR